MRKHHRLALCCLVLMAAIHAQGKRPGNLSQTFDEQLGMVEDEFVSAAEAMPEEKYSFAPQTGEFTGARTFAQQIKHVAAENILFAAMMLGEKPSIRQEDGLNGPENVRTKAEILKFLRDSFALSHRAMKAMNERNQNEGVGDGRASRIGIANIILWHSFDHYGQMAVYLRLNGIVPPASRPQKQ